MTIDSKCHARPAGKAAASSLIIQLPTTSAGQHEAQQLPGQQTESDPHHCQAASLAGSARLQPAARALDQRRRQPRPSLQASVANATANANLTTSLSHPHPHQLQAAANQRLRGHQQPHHHQRISRHRYQTSATHASIDHHLLSPAVAPAHAGAAPLAHGEHTDSSASTDDAESAPSSGTPPPNYHEIPGIVPSYHGRTSGPPPAYDDVMNPNAPPPSYQSLFGQVREARKTSNGLVDLLRQLFLVLIGTLGCTMIIGFLLLIPITMIFIGLFYMNECRAENIPSFLVIGGFVWILKNILNCYNQFKKDSNTINRPPPPRRPALETHQRAAAAAAAGLGASSNGAAPSGLASGGQQAASNEHPTASSSANQSANAQQTNITLPSATATMTTTTTTTTTTMATTMRGSGAPSVAGGQALAYQQQQQQQQASHQQHIRHPPMIGITSYKCESFLNYFLIVWFLAGCIVVYRIYEPDYENPLSASYCNRTVYLYAFWLMTSAFIIMAIILSCLCCLMASSLMSCSHGR